MHEYARQPSYNCVLRVVPSVAYTCRIGEWDSDDRFDRVHLEARTTNIKHLACSSIRNTLLCNFFVRDDTPKEVNKYLPSYRKEFEQLHKDGLWHNGKHYKVEMTAKANYKVMRLLAGPKDGEPSYGCATRCCRKDCYDRTLEDHAAATPSNEEGCAIHDLTELTAELTTPLNHEPEDSKYPCPTCGECIQPDHVEDCAVGGGSFACTADRDRQCQSHFSFRTVMVLRDDYWHANDNGHAAH